MHSFDPKRPLPRLFALAPILVLTAALTLALAPTPAQAAVTGSTSVEDLTLRNSCQRHPVDYTVAVGAGTLNWQLKITVFAPGGGKSEGFDLSSASQSLTEGTVDYYICGSSVPGDYTVRAVGSYQAVPALNVPFQLADSTFTVKRTRTRTALNTTHLRGNRYLLAAAVKAHRTHGFRPVSNASVVFQRRVAGKWRKIQGSRTFTNHGRARHVVKVARGTKVRAVTRHAGYLGGSVSSAKRAR